MYSIKLPTGFKGKNANDIFKELIVKNEKEFCIIYEKTYPYGKDCSCSESIGLDHMLATYAGQKLYEIAGSFTYYVPPPTTREPYRFQFTATDLQLVAETLCYVGYTYDDTGTSDIDDVHNSSYLWKEFSAELDAEGRFIEDAVKWINNVKNAVTEVACFGLCYISGHPPKV